MHGTRRGMTECLRRRLARFLLPLLPERRAGREDERLDDDRDRARALQHLADVDIVEGLELQPVDRDDRILELHLLAEMDADQTADVAVARARDRAATPVGAPPPPPARAAAAEGIEPAKRRRAAPRHENGDRPVRLGEV